MDNVKEKYDQLLNKLADFKGFIEDNDFCLIGLYEDIISEAYELKDIIDNKAENVIYINPKKLKSKNIF